MPRLDARLNTKFIHVRECWRQDVALHHPHIPNSFRTCGTVSMVCVLTQVNASTLTIGRGYIWRNWSVSLDRLDPNGGYTPDNVVMCSIRRQ